MAAHFPPLDTPADQLNAFRTPAQVRLIFEEFFLFQLGLMLRKRAAVRESKPRTIEVNDRIRESARGILPFKLTEGQRSALKEIVEDMQRRTPMNRLLQGDVGAGKTIVALLAALVAMENGLQVAFMAPTEILAEQHFLSLRKLLEKSRFRVELITGATTGLKRRDLLARLAAGDIHLVVGTHALVQGTVHFRSLGLAIIDEQHRFGVVQRATLRVEGAHARRAGHDGHAHPAHACADGLRRSRRVGHPRHAARPPRDSDHRQAGVAPRGHLRDGPRSSSTKGARPTSCIR